MSEPFPLPVDTRAVNVESRQYNLLGVDLGEGLPRTALKVGAFFYIPWWALLLTVGVPLLGPTMVLWILPPTLTLVRGLQKDAGGRLRLVAWVDRLSWWVRKHPSIVNADTAAPGELAPIATDLAFLPVTLHRPPKEATGVEALPA